MTDTATFPVSPARAAAAFPTLTPPQMSRVAAHGQVRRVEDGEFLSEAGDSRGRFFVARTASVEVVRPATLSGAMIAILETGKFTGEANVLLGRRSLVHVRARGAGDVIELTREQVLSLVQTD